MKTATASQAVNRPRFRLKQPFKLKLLKHRWPVETGVCGSHYFTKVILYCDLNKYMYSPEFTVWGTVPRILAEGLKVCKIE